MGHTLFGARASAESQKASLFKAVGPNLEAGLVFAIDVVVEP